jgi:5-methylcytosine-specific restriction enzyme A
MPKKPCAHPGCFRLIEVGTGYCDAHAQSEKQDRDRPSEARRRTNRPSRKWYASKAWRGKTGRRLQQLDAEPLCRLCPEHSKQLATVADHVVPHRDDHGLFWFGALQSLCKSCHDGKKQRAERRATVGGGL